MGRTIAPRSSPNLDTFRDTWFHFAVDQRLRDTLSAIAEAVRAVGRGSETSARAVADTLDALAVADDALLLAVADAVLPSVQEVTSTSGPARLRALERMGITAQVARAMTGRLAGRAPRPNPPGPERPPDGDAADPDDGDADPDPAVLYARRTGHGPTFSRIAVHGAPGAHSRGRGARGARPGEIG